MKTSIRIFFENGQMVMKCENASQQMVDLATQVFKGSIKLGSDPTKDNTELTMLIQVSQKAKKQKPQPKGETVSINFDNLLAYINSATGRKFEVINDTVRQKYRALIKQGYKQIQIRNSIDNACASEHHKENGFQYLTPEFFSRSSTIDKYGTETSKKKPTDLFTPKTENYSR